jgi:hypothetical protein
MVRNETFMPSTVRYGRKNTQCPLHRECDALNTGRGIGYCDFDGSQTICDGDRRSCDKPDALRDYFLNNSDKGDATQSVRDSVKVAYETRERNANSRDTRTRRSCPRVSVALPLEYWKRSDSCPQAGVSGNLSERGLLIYSISKELYVDQELRVRAFFPYGYELDSFKVIAKVMWKKAHSERDWKGYKYGLKFIQISRTDREKLKLVLCNEMTDHTFHGESDPEWSALA